MMGNANAAAHETPAGGGDPGEAETPVRVPRVSDSCLLQYQVSKH